LTPVLGVGLGALLLNEPQEPVFVGGAVLVLAGVALDRA
jgi:drug/metabolite transporter (DMT)-like permease